jgi:hypothetical protein
MKFAKRTPKNKIITAINKLGKYVNKSHKNFSTSSIPIATIEKRKKTKNI